MVHRRVRRHLLEKLDISPQALSQRAARLKDKYGPMTSDEAVYVIAHQHGVDLSRYLPLELLDRIRSLVPRDIAGATPTLRQGQKRSISKSNEQALTYPNVSSAFIKKIISIGREAFPQIVILENSLRSLIEHRLSNQRPDWWNNLVPPTVQRNVQRTMQKEKKYPYREKRGDNPLLYCNFADLKEVVLANQSSFNDVISDFDWFRVRMDEVYMARNNLAHSILLSKDDISRIALFYRDWARLLEAAGLR